MSHLSFTMLFAALVAGAEALLGSRTLRERFNRAGYLFACAMVTVVVGGWVMFLIHR